jgi:hypothetical protein
MSKTTSFAVEDLLARRRKAIAYARSDPEHALHEVRKVLEIVAQAVVQTNEIEVKRSRKSEHARPTLDEILASIEQSGRLSVRITRRMRLLQAAGNHAMHVQDDRADLSPESAVDYLTNLDGLLREVLRALAQ